MIEGTQLKCQPPQCVQQATVTRSQSWPRDLRLPIVAHAAASLANRRRRLHAALAVEAGSVTAVPFIGGG
jgi:hypothetical protein